MQALRSMALAALLLASGCLARETGNDAQPAGTPTAAAGHEVRTPDEETTASPVALQPVCFVIHHVPPQEPGLPQVASQEFWLYGMRFNATPVERAGTAVVFSNGGGMTWESWDQSPDLTPEHSVARKLARQGLAVYTYNRLGYPGSDPAASATVASAPLDAAGHLHEVIQAVRSGRYALAEGDSCAQRVPSNATGHAKVVGASLSGGALVMADELVRFNDLDAFIQGDIGHMGFNPRVLVIFAGALPTYNPNTGKADFPSTTEDCLELLWHVATVQKHWVDAYCRPVIDDTIPLGELSVLAHSQAFTRERIATLPATLPVLLHFAEFSSVMTPENREHETQLWQSSCPCKDRVQVYLQKDAGHAFAHHYTAPEYVENVTMFLKKNGLLG